MILAHDSRVSRRSLLKRIGVGTSSCPPSPQHCLNKQRHHCDIVIRYTAKTSCRSQETGGGRSDILCQAPRASAVIHSSKLLTININQLVRHCCLCIVEEHQTPSKVAWLTVAERKKGQAIPWRSHKQKTGRQNAEEEEPREHNGLQ